MTIIEVLPTLKALNHKDKIRAIQFLANEVANEEDSIFVDNHELLDIQKAHLLIFAAPLLYFV